MAIGTYCSAIIITPVPIPLYTVEPPNNGHVGTRHFVLYREVVLFSVVKDAIEHLGP